MPVTAGTTKAIRFLRRLSGNMEPPVLKLPVNASQTLRQGDPVIWSSGRISLAADPVTDNTLVGFVLSTSASAPPFPTSAGVNSADPYTVLATGGSVSGIGQSIPEAEHVTVILPYNDCVFAGNLVVVTGGEADHTAAQADVGALHTIRRYTPTGQVIRHGLDDGGAVDIAIIVGFVYPQMPAARSTTAAADQYAVTTATLNPSVEFMLKRTYWDPIA